jgi:oligopeptide/dipeptide ABC transporter ATP-binding protein
MGAMVDLDSDLERPLTTIPGQPPSPGAGGAGCPFAERCPEAFDRCRGEDPMLRPLRDSGQAVACWARLEDDSAVEGAKA